MKLTKDQRGLAPLALVALAVVVLVVACGAFYMIRKNGGSNNIVSNLSEDAKAANSACIKAYNDKDFCAFASNWNLDGPYKMSFTSEDGLKTVVETDKDGNSRISSSKDGEENYSAITIGNSSYIKNIEKNNWMKYTIEASDADNDNVPDFSEEFDFETEEKADTTNLTAEGKEACGNLTCFKYKYSDSTRPDESTTVFFDDKDYKLRKMVTVSDEGTVEWTVEYDVSQISEPSPVVEMPTGGNLTDEQIRQLTEQFGN